MLAGHPEGYLEAFANICRNFAIAITVALKGRTSAAEVPDYPGIAKGLRGMTFIKNVIASGRSSQKWTAFTI